MKMIKNMQDKWGKMAWQWRMAVVIIPIFVLSAFYLYGDMIVTAASSMNVWTTLFKGKLHEFYTYRYPAVDGYEKLANGKGGGVYDFCIYFIYSLYLLPGWIWEKVTGLSLFSQWATRAYVKEMASVFVIFSAYFVYKIARECDLEKEQAKWAPLIYLSSALLYYSEILTGAYDIISVAFSLLGIYCYLKKRRAGFVMAFAVAMACKMFALWIFIPLLLLEEKRIYRVILDMLAGISVIVVPRVGFSLATRLLGNPAVEAGKKVNNVLYGTEIAHSNLINAGIFPQEEMRTAIIRIGGLPLVIVGALLIWLGCYFYKEKLAPRMIVYLCAVVMTLFVVTCKVHPYWVTLLVPYIALLISFHRDRMWQNCLLEFLFTVGYMGRMYLFWPGCGSAELMYNMIHSDAMKNFVWPEGEAQWEILGPYRILRFLSNRTGITMENMAAMFGAVFLAGIIFFLYINFPMRESRLIHKSDEKAFKMVFWFRYAVAICVGLFPIMGYFMWKLMY